MYGLVNNALQGMVCSRFGENRWEAIKRNAHVNVDVFVSMEAYPDEVTYKLVDAASRVLDLSNEEILNAFGEYWVSYTAKEGYGEILNLAGRTLPDFLRNLDNLHTRVGLMFPRLKPPSFWCTDVCSDSLRLHYRPGLSSRTGLAPLVIGLLKGLAVRFNLQLEVDHTAKHHEGADHDEFVISFKGG